MPALTASSCLAANLDALGERNADIVAALQAVEPRRDVEFAETPQGVPSAALDGRQLCSRHRPVDEAQRLTDEIDLIENAVVVALGFGLGYHVEAVARRMGRAGVVIVLEPDLGLLRSVLEHVDHSRWLAESLVVWITDPEDAAQLSRKLAGAEAIVAQGVAFLEHPGQRARLGAAAAAFTSTFSEFVRTAKITLMTTLMRSVETVRNLLLNLDHYAGGPGLADLADVARGHPAVVVSAGPSLARNLRHLAAPGVRERCVIITAQTTLQPLLEAGVRPHFVTALDYHEISRRFYEGLAGHDLHDVTLVADPKAHPVILDAYPGPVRCCQAGFCDKLLGDLAREMGDLPAGSTVAHLAVYLARYLGCDPIAMIGQDLGFSDGLYYAPGTAIENVWAPELNPFNTIEMMQWQRIARHKLHLERTTDVHGRTIFTDGQMQTYRQQFERDFAEYEREGRTIIDATEGGVPKRHTRTMPLAEVLERYAVATLPDMPVPERGLDGPRCRRAAKRVVEVRHDVAAIRRLSRKTATLIGAMLADQEDPAKMARHFATLERQQKQVESRLETLDLLNHLNQMGVYKRFAADRRLEMRRRDEECPLAIQKAQLERDLVNVTWIGDAAGEFVDQLAAAERILAGEAVPFRPCPVVEPARTRGTPAAPAATRVAALMPIDPERSGLGVTRSLAEPFGAGRTVLQATLERLGRCRSLESIVLIAPHGFDPEPLIDRARIGRPLEIERVHGSPFPPEQDAIAAARFWCATSWRGGVAGMSAYDEILCPAVMHEIMTRRDLGAALLAAPDWPLVDCSETTGCEAVVRRHLEHADRHGLVFTQAPPGLGACVISASLMSELARRSRLATVGALLVYQPHAPQGDPIARDANVQVPAPVRHAQLRAVFDEPDGRRLLRAALDADPDLAERDGAAVVAALESAASTRACEYPAHVIIELTTRRDSHGLFAASRAVGPVRGDLPLETLERLFVELAAASPVALTFDGAGDPLLHPQFAAVLDAAAAAGLRHVHVRSELRAAPALVERLLEPPVEIVSIDLHADRPETYEIMMGDDRFREVAGHLERLVLGRRPLAGEGAAAAMALPWIVPRLQRRRETYEDLHGFFERWQHQLGACVIENAGPDADDDLAPAVTPPATVRRELQRRLTVLSDGSVPVDERDRRGERTVGRIGERPLEVLWADLREARATAATPCGTWSP